LEPDPLEILDLQVFKDLLDARVLKALKEIKVILELLVLQV
jgi:hypothetical protein